MKDGKNCEILSTCCEPNPVKGNRHIVVNRTVPIHLGVHVHESSDTKQIIILIIIYKNVKCKPR